MWGWQGVLSLLAVAWLLQCVGTWIQIRRYRAAFRELSTGWSDGWMGAGKGGRFPRAGAIAMIVVAPDEIVRRVVVIAGRTVFAKAERIHRFEGLSIDGMRDEAAKSAKTPLAAAITSAIDQVNTVRANQAARALPAPAAGAEGASRSGNRPTSPASARPGFSAPGF